MALTQKSGQFTGIKKNSPHSPAAWVILFNPNPKQGDSR